MAKSAAGADWLALLRIFLQRRDRLGQLLRLARAFKKGAERIETRGLVLGELVSFFIGRGGLVELAERALRTAEAEICGRDQPLGKRLRCLGHEAERGGGLVGLIIAGVGLAQPVVHLEAELGVGTRGGQRLQAGDGLRELSLGQLNFRQQKTGLLRRAGIPVVLKKAFDDRKRLRLAALIEDGPGQTEIAVTRVSAEIAQGEELAEFRLGLRPFLRVEQRLGLPIKRVGLQRRGHLPDRQGESRGGGIVAAQLVERLRLKNFPPAGRVRSSDIF